MALAYLGLKIIDHDDCQDILLDIGAPVSEIEESFLATALT
jgi:hypothetical protein